jgi:CubicO group peptidase (beta-lactamase class C family)
MKKSLLLFLSILTFQLHSQIQNEAAIDAIFKEWNKTTTPGCGLGIIKDGKLVLAKGYGMANLEYDIPNSANSVFRIGSTSKQFAAACVVLLAEQGKLSLEDNLKSFFPDFPAYAEKITVRHLLNHTSGIRDYLMLSYLKGMRNDDYYEDSEIMKWLVNQQDLNFTPGEEFLYSNSGYWLLGQIVNKVAGMNMADYAEKEIFEPLGMQHTHFHNDHTRIVKQRASGYMPNRKGGFSISMTTLGMIGDGGIFTSINDIKKWDDAFYQSKTLSPAFWKEMTNQGVLNNGEVLNYASGLTISTYKGLKTISHGGAFVGFRAELLRFPEQKFTVAIFTNRGDANPTRMAYQVADELLKEHFKTEKTAATASNDSKKTVFIDLKPSELEQFTGKYWNETSAYSRKIYVKNDTLRYYRSERSESNLIPISKNEFKMMGVNGDIRVRFDKNKMGNYQMSFLADDDQPIVSKRYQEKDYTAEELAHFVGDYYSKELDVTYRLKMEKEELMLFLNGNKISPLKAVMSHLFSNDDYGVFQFETEASGAIRGFRLAAGRVKNLMFVRKS